MPLDRLLVIRALRPDCVPAALSRFMASVLGARVASLVPGDVETALIDAGPTTPVFIFVSPGINASAAVEACARKRQVSSFTSMSLGQGQEVLALAALRTAAATGGWVLLQNIHLTMDWTWDELEKVVDQLATTGTAHPDFQ